MSGWGCSIQVGGIVGEGSNCLECENGKGYVKEGEIQMECDDNIK